MWRGKFPDTLFGHVTDIPPEGFPCPACATPVPRRGRASKDSNGTITRWLIRCPGEDCKMAYIIYNNTAQAPELMEAKLPKEFEDPAQEKLL
jgi:hypothetical protein